MFSLVKGAIFFILYVQVRLHVLGQNDCLKPTVDKKKIIKSKESIMNGAQLIGKETVESARFCYDHCCAEDECNVALMHYKKIDSWSDEGETFEKICYLFACGSPSVCTYGNHTNYAVIKLKRQTEEENTKSECPPGVPVAMCANDPCESQTCDAYKYAICRANYCGGCHAFYYDENNKRLNCTVPEIHVEVLNSPNEQSVTVSETDYEETPSESLPAPIRKVTEPVQQQGGNDEEDPYYQTDKRTWLEENKNTMPSMETHESNTDTTLIPIVIHEESSLRSIPLLVALIICIVLLVGLIYRFKCARKGKPKKFPVDDGDYLINGMYL